MHLCIFSMHILKSPYTSELLINASIKSPLWMSHFLQKSKCEILVLSHRIAPSMELWWFSSLNPTLTPLVWNLGYVFLGVSPSEGYFQSSHILSQPTKSWWHASHIGRTSTIKPMCCIIAVHYTTPYASWLHHRISITWQKHFNLSKSVGIQYPPPPRVYPW
jgi:hypothetical protein